MCVRDLKVYSVQLGGEISHYRDRYGLEADVVLHLEDGRYALIECKLGSSEIEVGASHLKELANLIRKHNKEERQVPSKSRIYYLSSLGGICLHPSRWRDGYTFGMFETLRSPQNGKSYGN